MTYNSVSFPPYDCFSGFTYERRSYLFVLPHYYHRLCPISVKTMAEVEHHLDFLRSKLDCCLVIDGESLQLCIDLARDEFIGLATQLSCVVACRCSPTQKADVARLIRSHTGKRVCCIGDGGNDVSNDLLRDLESRLDDVNRIDLLIHRSYTKSNIKIGEHDPGG